MFIHCASLRRYKIAIYVTGTSDVEGCQEKLFLLSRESLFLSQLCPRTYCPVTSLFVFRAGGITLCWLLCDLFLMHVG